LEEKPKVIVRIATPEDRKKLKEMYHNKSLTFFGNRSYAVAISQGKIVGVCEAILNPRSPRPKKTPTIIWVATAVEGKGIGHKLLGKMHSYIIRKGRENIILHAFPGTEGFYEKAGYKINQSPLLISRLDLRRLKHSRRTRK